MSLLRGMSKLTEMVLPPRKDFTVGSECEGMAFSTGDLDDGCGIEKGYLFWTFFI